METLKEFDEPTIVASKHANPCGVGSAATIAEAYRKAYEADPVSIYGGIVASNREIDAETASEMAKIFLEVIVAPSFSKEALEILTKKEKYPFTTIGKYWQNEQVCQQSQNSTRRFIDSRSGFPVVEQRGFKSGHQTPADRSRNERFAFAWKVVKHAKSNGITIAKNLTTTGVGPGQVSRIWALENAIRQGGDRIAGSVLASDAFFPFSDCVEAAHQAGITAIIQPGGSVRDQESIDAANQYDIAMIFTDMRHFKH